jgi:hypothetical protein
LKLVAFGGRRKMSIRVISAIRGSILAGSFGQCMRLNRGKNWRELQEPREQKRSEGQLEFRL